jgi:hypothetical protein
MRLKKNRKEMTTDFLQISTSLHVAAFTEH